MSMCELLILKVNPNLVTENHCQKDLFVLHGA